MYPCLAFAWLLIFDDFSASVSCVTSRLRLCVLGMTAAAAAAAAAVAKKELKQKEDPAKKAAKPGMMHDSLFYAAWYISMCV